MSSEDSTDESESDDAESVEEEETPEAEEAAEAEEAGGAEPRAGRDQSPGFLGTPAESDLIKEWVKFVAALLAVAGAGIGLAFFLYGTIEEAIYSYEISNQFGSTSASAVGMDLIAMNIGGLGILAGAVLGAYFGWKLDLADDLTFKAAAVCAAAGTFAMMFLAGFLLSMGIDNLDIEFAGLIINSIVVAILAGLVGAGGVWVARNQSPTGFGEDLDSPGPGKVSPSD